MSSSPEPLCHSGWKTPAKDDGNYASLKTEKQLQRAKAKIWNDCQKFTCSASKPQQRGYLQPTVSSRARALSPYTHRRMCQLADESQQRLGHLQLGPHLFKKSANNPAPFSVPLSTNSSLMESYLSSSYDGAQVHGDMDQRVYSFRDDYTDASLLRSSGRRDRMQWSHVRTQSSQETPSRREARPRSPAEVLNESTSLCAPAAARSSLKERFQALDPSPSYSEQIHRRVQRILQTHKAVVR
ncbi:unnamed protein product [Knipowitschia caucasica]